ncbi:glutathione peroxidase [Ligilactobacillus equi]|uniref:Glutathione peroxidase n=1 Tax=Ligilactobacillus equi DPC 6820 TaxID=1392007 RepID=V7HW47_9LACO|nr:glutathione peroxidase [Ligilactobacillus equi]ETA74132.1 glutathione peroxidase [Ligilactobacillus equi DPC 6820]
MEIYDFEVQDWQGKTVSLDAYRGQVMLIVNTATGCGFTPQYEGLENMYQEFKDQGFVVLDFPCNQFGHQAPGSSEEIKDFCSFKYHTTFPQFAKIEVNGPHEAPLYTFLKDQAHGILSGKIKWNFTKFLVDRQGKVIKRYAPTDTPEKISADVAEILRG